MRSSVICMKPVHVDIKHALIAAFFNSTFTSYNMSMHWDQEAMYGVKLRSVRARPKTPFEESQTFLADWSPA